MKYGRHLHCFLIIFLCFCSIIHARHNNDFYSDTSTVNKRAANEGEKEAITNAINKYLDVVGIKIADLNVSSTDDGGKEASGSVSFFGFDNIALKAEMTADRKIRSIHTAFPEAASITPDKLVKFLSGKSLNSFLPKSFPINTGISIKDLSLEFDDNGDSLSKVAVNFGLGQYAIAGFDGFAIDAMAIGFTLDKPTSPQHKATASVSGDGKIGAIPVNLSANMSSDPDDLLFSFTASGISISSLLNSFMSENRANSLLHFIPESIKNKELSSIRASINPTSKSFSAMAQTSFGEAEIQFTGATEESKSTMLFAVGLPAGFKFSQIADGLAPMDAIELSGTALIISTLADEDAKCNLSTLRDEGEIKIEEGVNIFSSIKLNDDLSKLLKVNQVKLRGTVNETFTNMSMNATLDLRIPMGPSAIMKEIVFGTRLGTINPIEFVIGGKIEAKIGEDSVGFNANFSFRPIDQKIGGEFFLAALRKKNSALVSGKLGPDGKSDLPEWTNPFGIPGVGLRRLGVSAGLDFKNPILLTSLGLTGAVRLGTVSDRLKHFEGDATVLIDILKPTNCLIDITLQHMTIMALIEAFIENANIQGQLRTMLSTGIDNARVLVVPVDGLTAFNKTYNKGILVSGQLSLGTIKGYGDFSMNDGGVSGAGSMDPVNWGNGAFILSGRTTEKPQFKFAYTKGSMPTFFVDGKVNLLGLSSETTVNLDDKGFDFVTAGKIGTGFEVTLEAKGNFSESNKGIYVRAALRNDLVAQLNQMVTGQINTAIQSTKTKLQSTRDALELARTNLVVLDNLILARTIILQGQKAADVQKIRDEALRAMSEKQAFINTCLANNATSQKRLNELLYWYDEFERSALYTAIASNNTAIAAAQKAYDGYFATVNGVADIVESFPNDPELIRLYIEKAGKQAAFDIAKVGVDVAEGVSVTTLEATKFVLNGVLGGVFDIKSAEFAGTFGLDNQYKINTALNFTLANKPYNMVAELDFNNLSASAAKIARDVLSFTLIKPGFAPTFAADLKKPVTNVVLVSAPKTLNTNATNTAVVTPVTNTAVMNGSVVSGNNTNEWTGKFFRMENLWRTGQRINIEKGPLVSTVMFDGAWSAQWTFKPVPGSNYFWIENRWKGGRLNIERGPLEASAIQDGAWSAQWELVKLGPNLYRIQNRWKPTNRINVENGSLECSPVPDGANSAMWYVRPVSQ